MFLAHSGFLMRCSPVAESLFILGLESLHIRGGCSLIAVLFFLMLVGTCCATLRSAPYVASFTLAQKFINNTMFLSGRNAIFLADGSMSLVL